MSKQPSAQMVREKVFTESSMKPNWENTFNSERMDWSRLGYVLDYARKGGYSFVLWEGRVYIANIGGTPTKWTKRDLYKHQG